MAIVTAEVAGQALTPELALDYLGELSTDITAAVVVDSTSLELLKGSELDYVEEMVGSAFQVKNPNATSSCGCGNSFSV